MPNPLTTTIRFESCVLLGFLFLFGGARSSFAHNPHDVIDALALSPQFGQDHTLFISIQADGLFKSVNDGKSWKKLVRGLDNQYALTSLAIAASYPRNKTLFVSSTGDGIYRSVDGGDSWIAVNRGLDSTQITLVKISSHYETDHLILAADRSGGLYRSADGGENWTRVLQLDQAISALVFLDGSGQILLGNLQGQLYRSTDNGLQWQRQEGLHIQDSITALSVSPRAVRGQTLFLGTGKSGIFLSNDDGGHFVESSQGINDRAIRSISVSPTFDSDQAVFASCWNEAVYKSVDGGKSWQLYSQGTTKNDQADSEQYRSPHFREVFLSPSFQRDRTAFLAGYDGLYKSTDGGQTWSQLETLAARMIMRLGVSPAQDTAYTLALTTYGGGIYTSADQGATWSVNNKGLDRIDVVDIGFSPAYHNDHTLFITSDRLLFRSTDSGQNWNEIKLVNERWSPKLAGVFKYLSAALKKVGLTRASQWALTKSDKGAIFPDALAVSPGFATDRTLYFGTRYKGIYQSGDAGSTLFPIWQDKQISSLAISSNFSSDRTLFAGVRGDGVYKTEDGGQVWTSVNGGLDAILSNSRAEALKGAPSYNIKIAISPDYSRDQTVFVGSPDGFFKTVDGGRHWERQNLLSGGVDRIEDIAVSPQYGDDHTVVASVRGHGLFRSTDGGRVFTKLDSDLIERNYYLKQVIFSPNYSSDKSLYGVSDEEVFRSTDEGAHWRILTRPIRYENGREVIHYQGSWQLTAGNDFSAASSSDSNQPGGKAEIQFVGSGITWIGMASPQQGIANVYLDGEFRGEVNQFSNDRKTLVKSFSALGLKAGPHSFMIEVTGTKSPSSGDTKISVDAFDILP